MKTMKLKCFGIAFDAKPVKVTLKKDSNHSGEWFWYCVKWDDKIQEMDPLIGFEERDNGKWRVYNVRKDSLGLLGYIEEYDTRKQAETAAKCRLFEEVCYLKNHRRNWLVLDIDKYLMTDTRYLDALVDIGERDEEKYNEDPTDLKGAYDSKSGEYL